MSWKLLGPGVEPLRQPEFRDLWIANFLSNLGTIMHGAAAAWLMTTLTDSCSSVLSRQRPAFPLSCWVLRAGR